MRYHTPEQTPELQYGLAISLPIISTIFTALRFRAREVKGWSIGGDDALILVALTSIYATGIMIILGTCLGGQGRHMRFNPDGSPVLDDERYIWFLKTLYAGQITQIFAIGPTKISVLWFYQRIFPTERRFCQAVYVLIGLVVAWMIAFFFANLLECVPISEAFKSLPGLGGNPKCINAIPMYFAQVYSDVILDALILLVPIPLISVVWKLQMPMKHKIAVLGVFMLGLITVLSSSAKLIIFLNIGNELQKQADITYFMSPIAYWPLIEATLQLVTACLANLRPLMDDWRLIFSSRTVVRNMRMHGTETGNWTSNSDTVPLSRIGKGNSKRGSLEEYTGKV